MKKIAVVGAGFSGLSLAYLLKNAGFSVEVFEKQNKIGGLIQTESDQILIESAAHAFLATQNIEKLFQDLNVSYVVGGFKSKAKWIFRQKPRRWPLTLMESMSLLNVVFRKPPAKENQNLESWIHENLNTAFADYLIGPALQGVYAAQPKDLSATLILQSLRKKSKRGLIKGSLAPLAGMSEILKKLADHLLIHLGFSGSLEQLQSKFDAVVVATSFFQAGDFLKSSAPILSARLLDLPAVSLQCATLGYVKSKKSIEGFGCLFPIKENFHSLGVLFNTDLFENRGPLQSETWILSDSSIENSSVRTGSILDRIKSDRKKLFNDDCDVTVSRQFNWPLALPLYGLKLESLLKSELISDLKVSESKSPVYLTGNYLGRIGLSKIYDQNIELTEKLKRDS